MAYYTDSEKPPAIVLGGHPGGSHMTTNPSLRDRFRAAAPRSLVTLLERLHAAGHAAYLAGGSVRDLVGGAEVSDWDVATSAHPPEVADLFARTTLLHAAHGTVQVRLGRDRYELTTFRADGPYGDGRRPDHVRFSDTIDEDLARRDFTINAMAYDPLADRLEDPHGGRADLEARVLRTVGDPAVRFGEDALRLVRAARFVSSHDLTLESVTRREMTRLAPSVSRVSAERVRDELAKMLSHRRPSRAFRCMADTGLLDRLLPELSATIGVTQNPDYHAYDVFDHTLAAVDHVPPSRPRVRWAALLHDVGKAETRELRGGRVTFYGHERVSADAARVRLTALRLGRREVDRVVHLIARHMWNYQPEWSDGAVRRFVARVGRDAIDDLFALRVADKLAKGPHESPPAELDALSARIQDLVRRESAFSISDLAVDGRDLMAHLGLSEGVTVGRLLRQLLDHVLEHGENRRDALLAVAERLHAGSGGVDADGR